MSRMKQIKRRSIFPLSFPRKKRRSRLNSWHEKWKYPEHFLVNIKSCRETRRFNRIKYILQFYFITLHFNFWYFLARHKLESTITRLPIKKQEEEEEEAVLVFVLLENLIKSYLRASRSKSSLNVRVLAIFFFLRRVAFHVNLISLT